ncbi:unnamed protein product, partial [Lampetra planeri]
MAAAAARVESGAGRAAMTRRAVEAAWSRRQSPARNVMGVEAVRRLASRVTSSSVRDREATFTELRPSLCNA